MHGSDRGAGDTFVGWFLPTVGICLAVFLAWGMGYLQAREAERRQQTPAKYSRSAKDDAQRACVGTEPGRVFECVYEKVEAAKEQASTEQDLSAQQRAASSSLASAIVSAFTLLVSIAGVWFVKRTLDATLRAVEDTGEATKAMKDANDIARSQSRPVMVFKGFFYPKREEPARDPVVVVVWNNLGPMPARVIAFELRVLFVRGQAEQAMIDDLRHALPYAFDHQHQIVATGEPYRRLTTLPLRRFECKDLWLGTTEATRPPMRRFWPEKNALVIATLKYTSAIGDGREMVSERIAALSLYRSLSEDGTIIPGQAEEADPTAYIMT